MYVCMCVSVSACVCVCVHVYVYVRVRVSLSVNASPVCDRQSSSRPHSHQASPSSRRPALRGPSGPAPAARLGIRRAPRPGWRARARGRCGRGAAAARALHQARPCLRCWPARRRPQAEEDPARARVRIALGALAARQRHVRLSLAGHRAPPSPASLSTKRAGALGRMARLGRRAAWSAPRMTSSSLVARSTRSFARACVPAAPSRQGRRR